ncbi:hypothetical protein FRC0086_00008 [Corynebacterium diphtheriae]|nr:hypothetical protein FRC0086_00008 [Corynebacterium diphtheriae]CAB0925108.1 hypothetical protein FRC0435_00303 [Corynebacterium diphtheriae]CAB0925348.1 hypothetical protein FRC0434_00306 [Corynebacterium diphtheriae]
MKKVVLTFLVAPVVPTSLAAENTRAQSCAIATSNVEYKKYIKAHNSMCISYEDDDVVVEVTFLRFPTGTSAVDTITPTPATLIVKSSC